ncbi:ABC transporter ATP-binding protein [Brevibacillus laterosporus]|uniref:Carnitine transport ATP-binding protein OpuCA n=1 Tax=Brevibacillus laterosporus TaxID=1465 RepID=A0AAP8QBK7_BRELA|nr:ABC transporter ATP-binding protein [Brevibacillus laterosporus]MCR8981948.1 ABC transporter ATP-binding protein [Brevibacillus laterosporus]MCZ0809103.1 ABC transporter ATP-binding protein [Brevibacillus laterosporus]MCZ0827556.1 ABC transporter ATP-binding protein [Brevibacillus laterosporus]MCZ0850035.1 ABC transporter ATP-binding protein [Brevibacillus laterosporus]MED1664150.1 ABC transporter ATP-binding protein [Brevibacillus laterosporus]
MTRVPDVEFINVQKKFQNQIIVDNFHLQIEQGEFISLLGPSGCGKTTTLNMIAGFLDPDQGDLLIKGKKMNGVPPYKRELGMVFQTYSLFPHMTVGENIGYGLKLRKISKVEQKDRIRKVLELVKLPHVADRYPKQLSGGQRQRIAIARALVVEPSLLLLDEPLSNLDAKLREELRDELKRLHQKIGVTTIFVTHDQEEALSLSDRIVVMNYGRVEQIGRPHEIYNHPATEFVHTFIGKSNRIPGLITASNGQIMTIKTDGDWEIQAVATDTNLQVGQRVIAYVRPEKIKLFPLNDRSGDKFPVDNQVYGQLAFSSFLGAYTECKVQIGSVQLEVRVQESNLLTEMKQGVTAICQWEKEDVFVMAEGR